MKHLFLLLLFALGLPAQALTCYPSDIPLGTGTEATVVRGDIGWGFGWYCPGKFSWQPTFGVVQDDFLVSNKAAVAAAFRASDVQAALAALYTGIPDPAAMKLIQSKMPAAPPNPVWVVAKNGLFLTRPVYQITNGELATSSSGNVSVGTTCDCVNFTPLERSTTTYCMAKTMAIAEGTGAIPLYAVCSRTN